MVFEDTKTRNDNAVEIEKKEPKKIIPKNYVMRRSVHTKTKTQTRLYVHYPDVLFQYPAKKIKPYCNRKPSAVRRAGRKKCSVKSGASE